MTRTLDELLAGALAARASDLHFEPDQSAGLVRRRVDGFLAEATRLDLELFGQVVARLKLLSGMDIAERRRPQDGRYCLEVGSRTIDLRVSSMPTMLGERLAVRLLDLRGRVPELEELGMSHDALVAYRRMLEAPSGFIAIVGPTGSGKTTTLYASLRGKSERGMHVASVEDPVEARIPGIAQVQVNARAGLTFASALRGFFRQDCNVMMIGELRDAETSDIAISAALSGHLVLSTLHAGDAAGAVERLSELGVRRTSLAAALTGIVAQRLMRRLCMACRRPSGAEGDELTRHLQLEASTLYEPGGCVACAGTGYDGRVGIFEVVWASPMLCEAIAADASASMMAGHARSQAGSLLTCALERVACGETSLGELRRVVGDPRR
ncbi:MAG: GspE/PulE family protein [Vulcanimicrobiaceae bacterium]